MIESIITGAVAIVVCMLNNIYQTRKNEQQHERTIDLIDYKLGELTKRVDRHNNVIERTYSLEQEVALQGEKIKVANNRIKDLEDK